MRIRMFVIGSCFALLAAACGGGDSTDEATEPASQASVDEETTDTGADPTTTTTTAAVEPVDETTTTTTTTTTTVPAAPAPPPVAAGDIADLVVAWGDGTGDPLDLAQRIIGFPLDISPPGEATPSELDLRLRTDADQWRWEWFYGAFTPVGSVQDIDAELPEGGPGTIEGRLYYDAAFEALGWRNVAQVISDPGSGTGGPQSVNWRTPMTMACFWSARSRPSRPPLVPGSPKTLDSGPPKAHPVTASRSTSWSNPRSSPCR